MCQQIVIGTENTFIEQQNRELGGREHSEKVSSSSILPALLIKLKNKIKKPPKRKQVISTKSKQG